MEKSGSSRIGYGGRSSLAIIASCSPVQAEADLSIGTALTQANTLTGGTDLFVFYLLQSDGTDSALFRDSETNSSGDGVFDSAESVSTLSGVSNTDLAALDGSSFTDFA